MEWSEMVCAVLHVVARNAQRVAEDASSGSEHLVREGSAVCAIAGKHHKAVRRLRGGRRGMRG
jgi:hypothetical protein